jgi:RND family efflux transporter MFP subunit
MSSRIHFHWLAGFLPLVTCWLASSADEPAEKPPEVGVVKPVIETVTEHAEFTGRTEASSQVDLRARATGYLLKVNFQEGAEVKQGAVLFEIDPRPCQAQFDQARAHINLSQAQLALAERTLARNEALKKQVPGSISEQDLDQSRAAVIEAKARIKAQEASLEIAKLNLDFTQVRAPISGRIGRRLIDPGNLVKSDETLLAVIVSRDPIYVYFDIGERTALRLSRLAAEGKKSEKVPALVGLATEEGFPHQGVVDFRDNRVDPQTGTLRVRAVLDNKDGRILPGMFVRVRLPLSEPYKALLIPAQAILSSAGERFVLLVNDKNVIEHRPVVLGQEVQGRRVVTKGLKPAERVVVQGLHRLRPGMVVEPREVPNEEKRKGGEGEQGSGRVTTPGSITSSGVGAGILVEASYPGASAEVVSEAVRAPIEQQVNGLEKLLHLRSRCTSDGKYVAAFSFQRGTDFRLMQVLAQNRVALASPSLPALVQNRGITVTRGSASVLMIVNLHSPEGRYDQLYLSNYATIQIKDELSRIAGVSRTTLVGQCDYSMRIWLDPDKLASHNLTADDVVKALRAQNREVVPGRLGQPPVPRGEEFQYKLNTLGRLTDPDEFAGIILKTGRGGAVVYLKDVARIELGADRTESLAALDGKPVATLVVALTGEVASRRVRNALRDKLAEICTRLPKGLDLDLSFDFTQNLQNPDEPATPEYLLLDVGLPAAISIERTEKVLGQCTKLLREMPEIQHVLALTENPFDLFGNGPCLLLRLTPAEKRKTSREALIQSIRKRLDEIKDMSLRVRDLSGSAGFPRCGYPVDLALRGPELDRVREWAENIGERLRLHKKLTDLSVSAVSKPGPISTVEVDRQRAAALGVQVSDIFNTVQVYFGSTYVNDFNRFGRTWQVNVQAAPAFRMDVESLKKLKVRNQHGEMVPLGVLVSVRETNAPMVLDFLDALPMVQITANPAPAGSLEETRKLCETAAEEARKELRLSKDYRLIWLQDISGSK